MRVSEGMGGFRLRRAHVSRIVNYADDFVILTKGRARGALLAARRMKLNPFDLREVWESIYRGVPPEPGILASGWRGQGASRARMRQEA